MDVCHSSLLWKRCSWMLIWMHVHMHACILLQLSSSCSTIKHAWTIEFFSCTCMHTHHLHAHTSSACTHIICEFEDVCMKLHESASKKWLIFETCRHPCTRLFTGIICTYKCELTAYTLKTSTWAPRDHSRACLHTESKHMSITWPYTYMPVKQHYICVYGCMYMDTHMCLPRLASCYYIVH